MTHRTPGQSFKHFWVTRLFSVPEGRHGSCMFKVTKTILNRAGLVWCSVQTWVGGWGQGEGPSSQGVEGAWALGEQAGPPSCICQKFQPYCWRLRNSIHIADSFTLSSPKGCFLKAYLILKDAQNLFHLFQSQLLLLRSPGDLSIDQTKLTGPPGPVNMGFPDMGSSIPPGAHPVHGGMGTLPRGFSSLNFNVSQQPTGLEGIRLNLVCPPYSGHYL